MGRQDFPAVLGSDPSLRLPSQDALAWDKKLGTHARCIVAYRGNNGVTKLSAWIDWNCLLAIGADRRKAVILLSYAIADRDLAVEEELVETWDIVREQGRFVTKEDGPDFGDDFGLI